MYRYNLVPSCVKSELIWQYRQVFGLQIVIVEFLNTAINVFQCIFLIQNSSFTYTKMKMLEI